MATHSTRLSRPTVAYDSQLEFGQVLISDIELDIKSRDDVPRVLLGLQALFCDKEARTKIFVILEQHPSRQARLDRGRPGMELWRMFVLGVVKMALNYDFDRLHTLACSHFELRQMLGHAVIPNRTRYRLQTIIDKVSLLSEETLREITAVVVACGHKRLKQASDKPLACRVDSAVTNPHAARQVDEIERRLLKNETIPHAENVFSINEPHTQWINKGKAGVKAELGLAVCFLED